MNIGIYNPYLDSLGGGERYCFDIASCLVRDHTVDIFWDDPTILTRASERFHMSTVGIHLAKNIWKSANIFSKIQKTRRYDAIFFISDGSIPYIFAKKTILIFQFPVDWVRGKDFFTQLKIRRITNILCYSLFVKEHIDRTFLVDAIVLPPCVKKGLFPSGKKERIIFSVGRFTSGMNTKKQDVLIDVFKRICDDGLKGWRLVLAGGALSEDMLFVRKLKHKASGYPIEIIPNISFEDLKSLYARSRIYWHAAGFGENLETHPERAEHFGITTVEAMSAGAVPIVFGGGGQKEVVGNWINGFLWMTEKDLERHTLSLIENPQTWLRVSKAAQIRAQSFSREGFCQKITGLL